MRRNAFALYLKPQDLFKQTDLNKYAYDELLLAESTQDIQSIKQLVNLNNTTEQIKLRGIQYVPTYLAPHLLSLTATTAAEMALVLKSVMTASLLPITMDTELDAGKTTLLENVNSVPAKEPTVGPQPTLDTETDQPLIYLVDNRHEELCIAHGGLVLQWCLNFDKPKLKESSLIPETSKGIVLSF